MCATLLCGRQAQTVGGAAAEEILNAQGCAYGCACRGTWSHYAFFCVHEKMRGRRWKWLGEVQALRSAVEPGVGKAACGHLEQAMGDDGANTLLFDSALQLLEDLIARGAEEEAIDEFDFPVELGWERSVRGLVGGLIVAPSRGEQEQGGGGEEAQVAKPAKVVVVRQVGKRAVAAGLSSC